MLTSKPELLIPAGNLEKLKTALLYGADAVYVGLAGLSLRAAKAEMSLADLELGLNLAYQKGVKVYVALNAFMTNTDLDSLTELIPRLNALGVDGVIVADPGVLSLLQQLAPQLSVHLSTQANITNLAAVRFWQHQGVKRVVLARELSLKEMGAITSKVNEVEFEIFVHGAMCMAYSGRCFLSEYLTDRSSNRGDCSQPCRFEYLLYDKKGQAEPLLLTGDERYNYLLSSKDLCMIAYLPQILAAGVTSLKVEGRIKSAYYVALVTKIYREALDLALSDPEKYQCKPEWLEELQKLAHRGYTTGFYLKKEPLAKVNEMQTEFKKIQTHELVGKVLAYDPADSQILVEVRNRLQVGDQVEILLPEKNLFLDTHQMVNQAGEPLLVAHNTYQVKFPVAREIPEGAILRKKISG